MKRANNVFEPIDFRNFNEADVREEIIAPLIKILGYSSGTENNVIREQSLRYPRIFIGRKNQGKDPLLRGKADYILEVKSTVRWVIEAKAANAELDQDAIDQAYTYANHPEVRAVYFSLMNGKRFMVFQTNLGPHSEPLLDIAYEDLEKNKLVLMNVLSPNAILRDHPRLEGYTGEPIGIGLRSVARVTNGVIIYLESTTNIPALTEMQITISGGAFERDENDQLVGFIETVAPIKSIQNLNQRLGLTSFEMYSSSSSISSNPYSPTIFYSDRTIIFPAGEQLLDINSWQEVTISENIICRITSEAIGHLENNCFYGKLLLTMNLHNFDQQVKLIGKFEIYVA